MSKIERCDGKVFDIDGCLGCACAQGGIHFPFRIFESKNFLVTQDFEVPLNGFVIISSKRHCVSINDFSADEKVEFIQLVDRVLCGLKLSGVAKEFILLQGERSDVHFHLSLFPRLDWMKEKFERVVAHMKQIQEFAKENFKDEQHLEEIKKTCKKLRKYLNEEAKF